MLNRLESVMTKINTSLTDPESPMYLKNVKKLPVNENGVVILDKNNPEHREWAGDAYKPKAPALKLAFIGPMRSGKSEAARYLAETYDFECVSFGDHLRYCVETVWGVNTTGVKPRAQLQQLGQLAQQFDPDVWVKPLAAKVFQLTAGNANRERQVSVVIDDLRQPNEYEWCKANGFTIVRVISGAGAQKERMEALGEEYEPAQLAHETEQYHRKFDAEYQILNGDNDTLELLHAQLDALIERLAHEYYEGVVAE